MNHISRRREPPPGWAVSPASSPMARRRFRLRTPSRHQRPIAPNRSGHGQDERLAMVAHELRGPLQPIRLATALLARLHENGPAIACKALSVIERQMGHLTRLVEDLLDDARLTHGKLRLVLERVRLNDVIEAAIDANRALIDAHRLRLDLEMPSEPVWLQADAVRLTQVFSNLLHNAAKFSVAGGTIAVRVDAGQADRPVAVSVRDEGIGMGPNEIGSVFKPFRLRRGSRVPDRGGLGIGLSVVGGLVKLHGGTVTARSDGVGTGSEFVVTLPLRQCAPSGHQLAG